MKKSTSPVRYGIGALFAAMLAFPVAAEETDPNIRAIESTRTLIEKSSSAQQIDQSKVPAALAKRDEARTLLKQAEAARQAGNLDDMKQKLNYARKQLFAAVQLANPDQVTGEKKARDFETRMNSTKVLRDALKRLGGPKNEAVVKDADANLAEASKLASEKKFDLALASVEKADAVIKIANVEQRDHTEQVASKNFTTKEDEYKYEISRNDEYAQLSNVVLARMAPQTASMYKAVGEKALGMRKDAEGNADKKDFAAAVTGLENSTAEYKKVIRAGGIPVP